MIKERKTTILQGIICQFFLTQELRPPTAHSKRFRVWDHRILGVIINCNIHSTVIRV